MPNESTCNYSLTGLEIYNDDFFEALHGVTNALDNIDASKCSSFHLSEAGNVAAAWLDFNLMFFFLIRNVHG